MPELPEVEITARRLHEALAGAQVSSARAPGVNTLKSIDPPLAALEGAGIEGVGRRGKHLLVRTSGDLVVLTHLMSAGRLQLLDAPPGSASRMPRRDRTVRFVLALADGRELCLREFGSKQAAWVRLVEGARLEQEGALAGLGPEAWPAPPPLEEILGEGRPLHALLRDQHVIAGIGRSWVDEILWEAALSPYRRGSELTSGELAKLREAMVARLAGALEHYEQVVRLPIPTRLPMPLLVHGRQGEPCPRCASASAIAGVHFEDYVIAYCPRCQTQGRLLKDRRLSRLLR